MGRVEGSDFLKILWEYGLKNAVAAFGGRSEASTLSLAGSIPSMLNPGRKAGRLNLPAMWAGINIMSWQNYTEK